MELSVRDLVVIVNTMHDVFQEIRKPFFMRFFGYGKLASLLGMQRSLFTKYVEKLDGMMALYLAYKKEDKDD
jgi:hypothetical protein